MNLEQKEIIYNKCQKETIQNSANLNNIKLKICRNTWIHAFNSPLLRLLGYSLYKISLCSQVLFKLSNTEKNQLKNLMSDNFKSSHNIKIANKKN